MPTQTMPWIARLFSTLAALLVNALLAVSLAVAGLYAWIAPDLPDDREIGALHLQQPLRIYSADGLLMAEFGAERREPLAYADTPPLLVKAFLAAEDSRFFEHPGVDVQGLLRATRRLLETGVRSQGGSTITMQVARNFFLSPEKTYRRKLTELALALRLETRLSKERIFELYQNKIFFGHRAYGITAAARTYYDSEPAELSLAQMAMLAGVPQAPSVNNPVTRPKQALARRAYVLGRMLALGYIDQTQRDAALKEPDRARINRPGAELEAPYAAEMVRQQMQERYGEKAYTRGLRVVTSIDSRLQRTAHRALCDALLEYDRRHGLRVPELRLDRRRTTDPEALDAVLVEHPPVNGLRAAIVTEVSASRARLYLGEGATLPLEWQGLDWARRHLSADRRGPRPRKLTQILEVGDLVRLQQAPDGAWALSQVPAVQGALVALSPADGAVLALVGGFDFERNQFNRAVDARRQPGSGFKPFVYAAALERGWTPATLVDDAPLKMRDGSGRVWSPQNFDHRFLGPIRLRQALYQSRNLATIRLLRSVGLDFVRDFLPRFGFDAAQLPRGLSLALGSGAASPWQMAGAFARFANGGFATDPYLTRRVENARGRTLFRASPPTACSHCEAPLAGAKSAATRPLSEHRAERVLEPRLAFQMRSLLADVIREGTGRRALALRRSDLAGKTGTSNDVRDSWFNGFNSDLVAVTWMGFDDYAPLGRRETGGRAALGMWMAFMKTALEGQPDVLPEEPPGLVHVLVNRHTGILSYSGDPDAVAETIRQEYALMLLGPDTRPEPVAEAYAEAQREPSAGPPLVPLAPRSRPAAPREPGGLLQQLF
jgi:penicillin-binding protein 1A